MNRIKSISIMMGILMSGMAFSDAPEDWLWAKSASPLDTDVTKTVVVCILERGCKAVVVNGE